MAVIVKLSKICPKRRAQIQKKASPKIIDNLNPMKIRKTQLGIKVQNTRTRKNFHLTRSASRK
jgi:hypothetical protein